MPWEVDPVTEQRLALADAVRTAGRPVAEAARRLGVSREAVVLGPRKLHAAPARAGGPTPPARTIAAILRRHGRPATRPRAQADAPPPQRFERPAPNDPWQLDHEGPPAILDDHSRHCLAPRPCTDMTYATTQAALWGLFGDVGPPAAIPCGNAFSARNTPVGLPAFDARLIRPGVEPIHGRGYHPQAQGKVERFNGTLQREVWPTARRDRLSHFASDLERWRPIYNAVRVVGQGGDIRWRRARVRVGAGLAGERARVVEAAAGLEVHHGTYHVRSVAGALLVPHRRA